jgi:uncharacterized protein
MSNFIWYDLMAPDVQAAKDFYSHVVGWTIADSGMPGMDYAVIKAGSVDVGGMMPPPPGAPGGRPMWNGYIHSADVDADAAKAVKLGGKIHQAAMDIPGVGRFAVIADPSEATFILFKPNSSETPAKVPDGTPGHIGWRELHSGDWKKAWDFYSGMFGWTKDEAMDMGPIGTYQTFKSGDGQSGGMMTKRPEDPSPPHWNYYFNVENITAAAARAKAKGATVLFEPMQVPGGSWIIMALDPQGASFCLLSSKK